MRERPWRRRGFGVRQFRAEEEPYVKLWNIKLAKQNRGDLCALGAGTQVCHAAPSEPELRRSPQENTQNRDNDRDLSLHSLDIGVLKGGGV